MVGGVVDPGGADLVQVANEHRFAVDVLATALQLERSVAMPVAVRGSSRRAGSNVAAFA
jgi:hypothetical protein